MRWQSNFWLRPYPTLIFILLLAFALRLYNLEQQSLWWDELKTVQRASMSIPELFADLSSHRAHLPLYFFLMRGWSSLGDSEFVVRFFSVMWGVLGIAAVFQLGRQTISNQVGLVTAFLLTISSFHIWYSQETRMYSLLPTLIILAHYLLLRGLEKNLWPYWLGYALTITAAIYTHYFALFILMAHYVFFALHFRQLRQQSTNWFKMLLLCGLLLLPWGLFIVSSANGRIAEVPSWISPIDWHDPLLTMWTFSVGPGLNPAQWLGYISTGIYFLAFIYTLRFVRMPNDQYAKRMPLLHQAYKVRLFFLWLIVPVAVTYLSSLNWLFVQSNLFSLYLDRYLIIVLPSFLLLVACGVTSLAKRWNMSILVALFLLIALVINGSSHWQLVNNTNHFRNDWRAAVNLLTVSESQQVMVGGQQDIVLPLAYYAKGQVEYIQLPPPQGLEISPDYVAVMEKQMATAVQKSNLIWHVEPFYNHDTHQFPTTRNALVADNTKSVAQTWFQTTYTFVEQHQFPGLRLTLYELSP